MEYNIDTIDNCIEALKYLQLDLVKESLEGLGIDLKYNSNKINYKNYLINDPITFIEPGAGDLTYELSDEELKDYTGDLGDGKVPSDIGVSEEMFKYIYKVESGYAWGTKLPDSLIRGKDIEGQGKLTYGAGLLYHPNGNLMMNIKRNWTQEELDNIFVNSISKAAKRVSDWAAKNNIQLTQNQLDALLSGCYNFGFGFLTAQGKVYSNTINMIKENPNNPDIKSTWAHISDKQGAKFPGLVKRRIYEANHYFA